MTQRGKRPFMKNIYFICTGNTCRSPMAEGLFCAELKKQGLSSLCNVKSAGLAASVGSPPSDYAVLAAKHYGADISAHRSNALTQYDLSEENYYICMSPSHEAILRQYIPNAHFLALQISDPFGGDQACYAACYAEIHANLSRVFRFVFGFDEIRPMAEKDVPAIAAIENECFVHPWSALSIEEELNNETARFFVAVFNGTAVGYVGANNISGEVYITNVAVLPRSRKNGIAKALLTKLIARCKAENAEFLTLEVRESNEPAKALYQSFGFTERGRRKRFYTDPAEDALIYTLDFTKTEERFQK